MSSNNEISHICLISILVESGSQGNPEEFQDIHQKQQSIDTDITDLKTKLSGQSADISTFRSQVRCTFFLMPETDTCLLFYWATQSASNVV